jgi:hypothetical protein
MRNKRGDVVQFLLLKRIVRSALRFFDFFSGEGKGEDSIR